MTGIIAIVIAYLVGGIPSGLIFARWLTGKDVRAEGSGNIGASNVLRTAGKLAGGLTLVFDIGKGAFSVWLADRLTGGSTLWMSMAALAVLLGHAFSVWLRFKGGKSVASFVGAFAYLTPLPMLAVLLLFVLLVAFTRYISLGSVVAAGLFPLACWMILHPEWPVLFAAAVSAALVVWRHEGNLRRIRAGNENKLRLGRSVP